MELERLRIDRKRGGRSRRKQGLGRYVFWGLLLLVLAYLGYSFRAPLGRLADRVRLPEVGVVRVEKSSPVAASAVSGTAANGYVVASRRAALSADEPGRIVEMNVEEGSTVRKGDVVARLYDEEYRAALAQTEADRAAARATVGRAEAQVEVAQAAVAQGASAVTVANSRLGEAHADQRLALQNLERARALVADGIEVQQVLDEAMAEDERVRARIVSLEAQVAESGRGLRARELELEVARAAVTEAEARVEVATAARELAQRTLEKTEVRAPFDGIVVLKDAEVGEVVSPNSLGGNSRGSVVTMVDFASLEVQVDMPERNISAVELGAPANVYLDAYPEVLMRGSVRRIWPTANRQKATVEVRVGFDEPGELLRPEMGARVVFRPDQDSRGAQPATDAESILIPTDCVVRVEGVSGVFELERDVARFRGLELGDERGGRVLVTAGLEGGERIVSKPPASLVDGDRVRLQE